MQKNRQYYIFKIFLPALLIVLSAATYSQDDYQPLDDISEFRKKMTEASSLTQSIASDFVQLKHLSFLEEDVESKGKFFFQQENKLRWEYSEPFFYLILFNNDTVMIQDEHKTNIYDAASGRMFREINSIMLSMVNGSILESENFEFEYFENASSYKLELIPLDENMKEFLSKIRLFINKDDFSVDELYMIERSGDFTQIRFINKRLNENIPQNTFDLP